MGMFSKDPDKAAARDARRAELRAEVQAKSAARARARMEKVRAKAQKKGVEVDGAIAIGHMYADSADQYLVVFPDRVHHVRMGKTGSLLLRSGAGTETIPVARISSVEGHNEGVTYVLEVHTSGNRIEFKVDQPTGPLLRQAILDVMAQSGSSAPTTATASDLTDQIKKLADLHAAGILTDEEFAAKKAELLERM